MSNYDHAFRILIEFEGEKYTDDPNDRGGPTKFGVTINFLREYRRLLGLTDLSINSDDIRSLKIEDAERIYLALRWNRYKYFDIQSTEVATRVLLPAVLFGPRRGHWIVQRACNCAGQKIKEDGIIGPITKEALNTTHDAILVPAIRAVNRGYVHVKYTRKPSDKKNFPGWDIRAQY